MSEQEETFASRPAAEGTVVTVIVDNEERTLEAAKDGDGWAITPTDAAEARALERFADSALDPGPSGYEAMNAKDLRALLAARELPTGGKKAELVDRLMAADKEVSTGNDEAAVTGEQGGQA